jgi:4-hydroxy-tetrahydrodipicolinate reductase
VGAVSASYAPRVPNTLSRDATRGSVAGVIGWTGRAVDGAVEAATDLELVSGVSRSDRASFSSVADALEAVMADVLVDFTHASVVLSQAGSA